MAMPSWFETSDESLAIVSSVKNNKITAVNAYAGSGKTTNLQFIVDSLPKETNFLYIAYNKTVADSAKESFPSNVKCLSAHALAYSKIGKKYSHKIANELDALMICEALEMPNYEMACDIINFLAKFFYSSCDFESFVAKQFNAKIKHYSNLNTEEKEEKPELALLSEKVFKMMQDTENKAVSMTHDCYLKLYQLGKPKLGKYDVILYDECQDANSAMLDIVLNQSKSKIVLVGDKFQSIYQYRGAIDGLSLISKSLPNSAKCFLSSTYRYGNSLSSLASRLLNKFYTGESKQIAINSKSKKDTEIIDKLVGDISEERAIICRSNIGVFSAAKKLMENGIPVKVEGLESLLTRQKLELVSFAYTSGLNPFNQEKFEGFSGFVEEIKTDKQDNYLFIAGLFAKYGLEAYSFFDNLLTGKYAANKEKITILTAHKSKGLEFEVVELWNDYPDLMDLKNNSNENLDAEVNLAYVALTRAKSRIYLGKNIYSQFKEMEIL